MKQLYPPWEFLIRNASQSQTCCLLPIAHCPLAVGCCLLAAVCCILAIGYRLLSIGYWLLSVGYWLLAIVSCLLDIEAHLEFFFVHTLVAAAHRNSLRVVVKIPKMPFFPIEPKSHHPLEVPLVPVYPPCSL
jgi:hypothetical protein